MHDRLLPGHLEHLCERVMTCIDEGREAPRPSTRGNLASGARRPARPSPPPAPAGARSRDFLNRARPEPVRAPPEAARASAFSRPERSPERHPEKKVGSSHGRPARPSAPTSAANRASGPEAATLPKPGTTGLEPWFRDGAPHAVLGLPRDVSKGQVRARFCELSLLLHPDKAGHSDWADAFHRVWNAYRAIAR